MSNYPDGMTGRDYAHVHGDDLGAAEELDDCEIDCDDCEE